MEIGIVGLPNVGKSTLFNALLKRQVAYVANYPFATIEPNVGVVPVPDGRLVRLAETVKAEEKMERLPPVVPATVKFVDIAGLIAGASQGEGLGNKFLSHIREVDAICHVLRGFSDEDIIRRGSTNPKEDLETIETELLLADMQTLEKQKDPGGSTDKELVARWKVVEKLKTQLGAGVAARKVNLNEEEEKMAKQLSLLTAKPVMAVVNVDESDLVRAGEIEEFFAVSCGLTEKQVAAICAKTEMELAELSEQDQLVYLEEVGVKQSGLERLVVKAFGTLGLQTFLTAGEKEVRAWTIKRGMTAPQAAGVIHTDFEKHFIKAEIVNFEQFVSAGGWGRARETGKAKTEGSEYVMKEGDVVEFKVGV